MPYLRVGPHVMSWCSAEPRLCREDPGPRLLLGSQQGRLRLGARLCPAMSQPQNASSAGGSSVGPREWVQPRTYSLAQGVVPTSFLPLPPAPRGPAHILPHPPVCLIKPANLQRNLAGAPLSSVLLPLLETNILQRERESSPAKPTKRPFDSTQA